MWSAKSKLRNNFRDHVLQQLPKSYNSTAKILQPVGTRSWPQLWTWSKPFCMQDFGWGNHTFAAISQSSRASLKSACLHFLSAAADSLTAAWIMNHWSSYIFCPPTSLSQLLFSTLLSLLIRNQHQNTFIHHPLFDNLQLHQAVQLLTNNHLPDYQAIMTGRKCHTSLQPLPCIRCGCRLSLFLSLGSASKTRSRLSALWCRFSKFSSISFTSCNGTFKDASLL